MWFACSCACFRNLSSSCRRLHPHLSHQHFKCAPCSAAAYVLQVGSFEEVLMRMSASEGGELAAWSQVMFVAPGLLQQAQQGRALEAPGGKKK